ncbi:unnamed protein product, partial [Pleuronectes platessa]
MRSTCVCARAQTHARLRVRACVSHTSQQPHGRYPRLEDITRRSSCPRHPLMGGALTGGRRVFSSFKSTGAGPSDKPRCVIDLGRLLKPLTGSEESPTHSPHPRSPPRLLTCAGSPHPAVVRPRSSGAHSPAPRYAYKLELSLFFANYAFAEWCVKCTRSRSTTIGEGDTVFCLSVDSKLRFGAAAGQERGLQCLTSVPVNMKSAEEDAYSYTPNVSLSLPLGMGNPCLATQYHTLQSSPIISVSSCHQTGYSLQNDIHAASGYYLPHGLRPNGAPALESPRIEITAYSQYPEDDVEESSSEDHMIKRGVNSIVTLTLPNADGYRDPSCLSPASSISSRSCNSEASSYESGFYNYDNSPQNSPWQSPCVSPKGSSMLLSCPHASGAACSPHNSPSNSPQIGAVAEDGWPAQPRGSRPNSPSYSGGVGGIGGGGGIGKRKYSLNGAPYRQTSCTPNQSPIPSPHISPRVSITDENWLANTNQYTNSAIVAAINALTTDGVIDMGEGIPIKTRKTMLDHSSSMSLKLEPGGEDLGLDGELCHEDYPSRMPLKKENYCGGFLDVPQHPYSWSKPKPYLSPSLPALDWQLQSCSGPYNLQIEVQPKSHHRAHYETEGSRGAVKALSGGHPVVQLYGYMESEPLTLQLFIGTADDRLLRPHAFYQVHRITGKTVSTASHEVMQSNTKVLEIPLLPENNMRAIIDCAGILKLRNSDIELRKGETDIGRKNTRVRLVFRVHINQPNGRTLSLQASSNPIECSQRSAQELPLVEKQSVESYPATGGKMMLLSGLNFLPDSKVVFVEKAQVFSPVKIQQAMPESHM